MRIQRVAACVIAMSLLIGVGACGSSGANDGHVSALASQAPAVEETPTPTPTPSATPTTPKPKPTTAKPTVTVPPPPGCDGFRGTNLAKSSVSTMVRRAVTVQEWKGLGQSKVDPAMWPIPKIVVPLNLVKAIAYMESGWRTACKARDGIGFGLFQISAGTQKQMNDRFGETFNRDIASGNTAIAVAYLEWIIAVLGIGAFGHKYDVTSNSDFLDAVIASFNVGPYAVLVNGEIAIPNPDYVESVRAMMQKSCKCQQW